MLLLTAILVGLVGGYIKIAVLKPLQLYQDESVFAVPFKLMTDDATQYAIQLAGMPTEPPTDPPTIPPTAPPTVPPTEIETAPPPTTIPALELEESWFDDALFIGNSLMVGFRDFARLGEADYFCSIGMTVYSVWKESLKDKNFGNMKLETLLQTKTYGKILIHLGTNDVGYPHKDVVRLYGNLVERIQEYQPDALIVIQAAMTFGRAKEQQASYMNPRNIGSLNDMISGIADGEKVRFVDVNEWCADEEGYLPTSFSSDGCHPYVSGYRDWSQWLLKKCGEFGIP